MFDLHSHIDLYRNYSYVVRETNKRNRFTVSMTTYPSAWEVESRMFCKYENIHVALGLHPEIIHDKISEKSKMISSIQKTDFVGEIGLDFSDKYCTTKGLQYDSLSEILYNTMVCGGKILSIHSRNAVNETLLLLSKYSGLGTIMLHWFMGTKEQVFKALDMGCIFTINQNMLSTYSGRKVISYIPIENILPESDAPFSGSFKSPIMPWQTNKISEFYALHLKCSYEKIGDIFSKTISDRIIRNMRIKKASL